MEVAINLASLGAGLASPFVDITRTGSSPRAMYSNQGATLGPNGWPTTPAEYAANYCFSPGTHNYTIIITKGSASNVRIMNPPARPPIVNGRATFDMTGIDETSIPINVITTAAGETRWAIVRTDWLALWEKNPLAFDPDWFASVAQWFRLRLMDWMGTNDNKTDDYWSGSLDAATFAGKGKGMPIEVIAQLANDTGKQLHLSFPVGISDANAVKLVTNLDKLLGPTAKPILWENGNEVWNAGFAAHNYAITQDKVTWWVAATASYNEALAAYNAALASGSSALMAKPVKPPEPDGYRWYGARSVQLSKLLQGMGKKVGVDFDFGIGCQPAQPGKGVVVFEGVENAGGSGADFTDWLITGYINGTLTGADDVLMPLIDADDLAGAAENIRHGENFVRAGKTAPDKGQSLDTVKSATVRHVAFAASKGIKRTSWYEGNLHMRALPHYALVKDKVVAFFKKLCGSPFAGQLMKENLQIAEEAGVYCATLFNDRTPWNEWGCFRLYGTPAWDTAVQYIADHAVKPPTELDAINAAIAELRAQLDALATRVAALAA